MSSSLAGLAGITSLGSSTASITASIQVSKVQGRRASVGPDLTSTPVMTGNCVPHAHPAVKSALATVTISVVTVDTDPLEEITLKLAAQVSYAWQSSLPSSSTLWVCDLEERLRAHHTLQISRCSFRWDSQRRIRPSPHPQPLTIQASLPTSLTVLAISPAQLGTVQHRHWRRLPRRCRRR